MSKKRLYCAIGIIDCMGVVRGKIAYNCEQLDDFGYHSDVWPISGRGYRWRFWGHSTDVERSDIDCSYIEAEEIDKIERWLTKHGVGQKMNYY